MVVMLAQPEHFTSCNTISINMNNNSGIIIVISGIIILMSGIES
jgi:hypothetical protein